MKTTSLAQLEQNDDFISRHIGPTDADVATMLECLDADFLEELISKAVPQNILTNRALEIGEAHSEGATLDIIYKMACKNKVFKSFIGMGYYGCITPGVILRNILEDPAWYTAYTPYQAEISQGRMAALLNFQTMIRDLTGLEIANASMLDEGTAAAEAMIMCHSLQKKIKKGINTFWVADDCHPQTIEVLQTRARPLGIQLEIGNLDEGFPQSQFFGMLVQYPGSTGNVREFKTIVDQAHAVNALVVAASDLLALTLLTPPGEMGADVVVGSAQRFGVPMGFGGPHAAFFATRDEYKRTVPGRIIGVSVDRNGKPALRLALQTREQHIRREKATSNICTSQVLLAVIASMYAVYHGPERLRTIAQRVHRLASILAAGLERLGHRLSHQHFFDTITLEPVGIDVAAIRSRAEACSINLRFLPDGRVGIALDETSTKEDLELVWTALAPATVDFTLADLEDSADRIPAGLLRTSSFMDHEVFNSYHSETEMLRYINELASRDLTLAHSMIPLGSCTMKLNATTEMLPITWKKFSAIHPFAPKDQVLGYTQLINELEGMLSDITGFPGISLQPNAGSQGEYAGLLTISHYHASRGESHRNICIIPSSAHGTNPASAVMAGMQVVVVGCDHQGNIDVADLEARAIANKDNLAGLMITYPSTHGVFEEAITRICEIIHQNGGQVYMDGANMNALVGLCRPGEFGPDVIHLNLHKTFCIPHGGGGPGIGPIGVAQHLKPFLPGHHQRPDSFPETAPTAVSAAPWGSASILPISWAYIRLMGSSGLTRATQVAILNANYIAKRLEKSYPILYKGINGMVAHECIIDLRPLKQTSGVEVEDVAKRLMDYGFHAPTMSWPVAGTLMIEPTESESLAELDRFCEALISIREEIRAIEEGKMDRLDNPLKNAPHVIDDLLGEWGHPYSRTQAVYPLPWLKEHKFWPTVGRIDNAYGDKNLVCSCLPVDSYK